jgi:hypothetical protein
MRSELRGKIAWHRAYRPGWDRTPDEYERAGTVGWGRSRRLGAYREGRVKAYVGVQHVDTTKAAWAQAGEPHARFFVSLFRDGVCVSLRTFPLMDDCLDALAQFVR